MLHVKCAIVVMVGVLIAQPALAQSVTERRKDGAVRCPGTSGLVAYFSFDVDARDDSGNGHDAIASKVTTTAGVRGRAFAFDGESSSLQVRGGAGLDARTLCAWIRPEPREGLAHPVFTGGARERGDFFAVTASKHRGGSSPTLQSSTLFVDHWGVPSFTRSEATIEPKAWTFVCYRATHSRLAFHVNGRTYETRGRAYDYDVGTLVVGGNGIGGTTTLPSFKGAIDEVSIWSRLLTTAEMRLLWNRGTGCRPGGA
jgi:hypothetical protein